MDRDELAGIVLAGVKRQCDEIRSRPKPETRQWWLFGQHELDLEFGPLYSPNWFENLTPTNAGRIRVLRVTYSLADAELLTLVKSAGGRLERIHLTATGQRSARRLENTKAPAKPF
jgi:hypothetical protein